MLGLHPLLSKQGSGMRPGKRVCLRLSSLRPACLKCTNKAGYRPHWRAPKKKTSLQRIEVSCTAFGVRHVCKQKTQSNNTGVIFICLTLSTQAIHTEVISMSVR
jgi:hypothetical protein